MPRRRCPPGHRCPRSPACSCNPAVAVRVLVDGDPIVYASAFAAQHSVWFCTFEDSNGLPYTQSFDGKKAALAHVDATQHPMLDAVERIDVEPVEHVLSTVRNSLRVISDKTGSDHLEIYLTASAGVSFRHLIAKQKGYKANRKAPRPVHYDTVRGYLVGKHGARVVTTREADDELSIQAANCRRERQRYVIATIDKDLDQIPGEHYDYRQHVTYYVDQADADRWFWIQAISGDPTDNIPGCWKVGTTKATDIVDGLLSDDADDATLWQAVVDTYTDSQSKKGCPYADIPAEPVAIETAQLVYLQQVPGEIWAPPGMPRGKVTEVEADELA